MVGYLWQLEQCLFSGKGTCHILFNAYLKALSFVRMEEESRYGLGVPQRSTASIWSRQAGKGFILKASCFSNALEELPIVTGVLADAVLDSDSVQSTSTMDNRSTISHYDTASLP